ncbi:MAG TPA: LEA type 2 family protein [Lysobacter sp.]|nr:LEA type 2 family protein [Lysobacter sp.]
MAAAIAALALVACASGPVRRVSEPAARIQQLTVATDGSWSVDLRLENYSSIPMRFDRVALTLEVAGEGAGTVQAEPKLDVGPESADVVTVRVTPSVAGKLAAADALGSARALPYRLAGTVAATPEDDDERTFEIELRSALSPAPGLPGVLR